MNRMMMNVASKEPFVTDEDLDRFYESPTQRFNDLQKRYDVMIETGTDLDLDEFWTDELMAAIDAGAEDVSEDGDVLKVVTTAGDLAGVRAAIEGEGVEIESAELSMEPQSTVEVGEATLRPCCA